MRGTLFVSVGVFFLTVLFSQFSFSRAEHTVFKEDMLTIQTYKNNFYGFQKSPDCFIRMNLLGQKEWQVNKKYHDVISVKIKFDKLFLLDKSGTLELYDSRYGYFLWRSANLSIQSFYLHYPYIMIVDSKGRLSHLDFFTGILLWRTEKGRYNDLDFYAEHSHMLGLKKRRLDYLEKSSGELLWSKPLKKRFDFVQFLDSEEALIFKNLGRFYKIVFQDKSLTVLDQKHFKHSRFYNNQFYMFYDPSLGDLSRYDLKKNQLVWTFHIGKKKKVIFSDQYWGYLDNDNQITICRIDDGSTILSDFVHSKAIMEDYDNIIEHENYYYLYNRNGYLKVRKI